MSREVLLKPFGTRKDMEINKLTKKKEEKLVTNRRRSFFGIVLDFERRRVGDLGFAEFKSLIFLKLLF